VLVPTIEIKEDLKQITQFGDNFSPRFSPQGDKVIFVSRNRPHHSYGQIYEINLSTQKEQRITFEGAENYDPQYVRDGKWILYSSATDETKEHPPQLNPTAAPAPQNAFNGPAKYLNPADLYLRDLEKFEVIRLTSLPGFDGDPFWYKKRELIVFTRLRGNHLYLFSMEAKKPMIIKPFTKTAGLAQWQASQDNSTRAWIQWAKDGGTTDLKVKWPSGYVTLLSDFDRIKKDPFYDEDLKVILFSMNHPDPTKFNIFSVNLDGTCLTQWTNNQGNNQEPALSPDHKSLAFASDRSGSFQIYLKDWPQTPPCVSSLNPVKSK